MNTPIIGILGGAFDPIHKGHLYIANSLMSSLPLTEMRFLPCKQQVLKTTTHASPLHRLAMLKLALKNYPRFSIDTRELDRTTPSYMVDTLRSLRLDFPHASLALILGADAFVSLPQWHEWKSLLSLAHIIVVNRPNIILPTHGFSHEKDLSQKLAGCIFLQEIEPVRISSTDIRDHIANKKNVDDLLPALVEKYIKKNNLYKK